MPSQNRRNEADFADAYVAGSPAYRPGTVPTSIAPYGDADGPAPAAPATRRKQRQLRRTLSFSSAEGMAAELITSFVGGSVLTGWAIFLGCSPLVIAMLGALPFLAQLVQFPAAWITSRFGSRRTAIACYAVGRLAYLPLIALPFLPIGREMQRAILLAVAGTSAAFVVMGSNAWTAWMGDVVPGTLRGRYFGKRLSLVTVSGAAGVLAAGLLLDVARRGGWEAAALAGLAAAASLAGAVTIVFLLQHQDAPVDRRRAAAHFELRAVVRALRDPAMRPLLRYQLAWNAAIGVASAFFAVHELQNLKMGYALIAAHATAVAAMRVFVSPFWGKLIDRVGAQPVLVLCSFTLPVVPLVWLLLTPGASLWPLVLDVILAGALWAGHMLAVFELPLAVAPREGRPYYLAAFSTAGGIAFAAASLVGGLLAQSLPATVHVFGGTFGNLHVLFALSAAGRLLAAPLALGIVEPGAQPIEAMLRVAAERMQLGRAQLARAFAFVGGKR